MEINRKKLMYAILREINKNSEIKYTAENFKVDQVVFDEVLLILNEENFTKGIMIQKYDNKVMPLIVGKPRITLKGIEFLEENSLFSKTYLGIKELREWLPF